MKLDSYFKNLPNMWSANFLAMLGFVSFVFSIIGIASLIFYSHINIDFMSYKIGTSIKDIGWYFILIQCSLLPVICLLGILPVITQYGILMRPSKNTHLQILLLAVVITLCTLSSCIFYAESGSGVFFAFIPFFCYPVLIAASFIFITLFLGLIGISQNKTYNQYLELETAYNTTFNQEMREQYNLTATDDNSDIISSISMLTYITHLRLPIFTGA